MSYDDDDDLPRPARTHVEGDSVLDQIDSDVLEEIASWWEDEAELAADAVREVMEETECSRAEALEALTEAYGGRADIEEIMGVLDDQDDDSDDDDLDEGEDEEESEEEDEESEDDDGGEE